MSSVDNAMTMMGYRRTAPFSDEQCRDCGHSQARASGLRCVKGGFYVVPGGSCNDFAKPADQADQERVSIGPTDV